MTKIISFEAFNQVYCEKLESIYHYWTPEMQAEIARHCYAWRPGIFDFKFYLQASAIRYYYAYHSILPYGRGRSL
jgi:hypothetical protein